MTGLPSLRTAATAAAVLAALVSWPLTAGAQAPTVDGAEIQEVAVRGDLANAVAAAVDSGVDWIGWRVPMLAGHEVCCGGHGDCCGTCRLDGRHGFNLHRDDVESLSRQDLLVFLEVEQGRIEQIRAFGRDCRLAADGDRVAWLADVEPAASATWLATVARGETPDVDESDLAEEAVGVLALHAGDDVTGMLAALARRGDAEVRESAIFWLGSSRGRAGYEVVAKLVGTDPDPDVRERAVFALHVSGDPRSTDRLIEVVHDDDSSHVREQAVFWLAQQAGKAAASAVEDAVEHDPDRDVKVQAVFALSQLPADEGVPLLIRVARSHGDPEVRKKALFWLGQSGDDRALDFIEELLAGGQGRSGG